MAGDGLTNLPVHPGLLDGRERDLLAILARADAPISVEQATGALADYQDDTRRSRVLRHLDDLSRGDLATDTENGWVLTEGGRNVLQHHVEWLANGLDCAAFVTDEEIDDNGELTEAEAVEELGGGASMDVQDLDGGDD